MFLRMYTKDDFDALKKQVLTWVIVLLGVFGIFLTIALLVSKNVSNPLGLFILVIGVCVDEFIWGVYLRPVVTYRKFVREILTGRERQRRGYVVDIGEKPVYKDNKLFYYEVFIQEDESDDVKQMLLLDGNKEPQSIKNDNWYEFDIYQNYITGINPIDA